MHFKTSKIWVDQGSKVYNKFFKKLLKGNNIEMYSTHNEGKSVVAQKFKKTLKSKIYKQYLQEKDLQKVRFTIG